MTDNEDDLKKAVIANDTSPSTHKATPQLVKVELVKETSVKESRLIEIIKKRCRAIQFTEYSKFINRLMKDPDQLSDGSASSKMINSNRSEVKNRHNICSNILYGTTVYEFLNKATEVFLLLECGVDIDLIKDDTKPLNKETLFDFLKSYLGSDSPLWLEHILSDIPEENWHCYYTRLAARIHGPCMLELIWNYWMEEAGLVQAMNLICFRFQNRHNPTRRPDPLREMELSPLREINGLLWDLIQDEQHRLNIKRRTYEYDHHYGITLFGKAVDPIHPVDSRSKFIEAFHYLLMQCCRFYQEDADQTVTADVFPILNGLKDVHLLLTTSAHNQYRDMPWVSRREMMIQQFLLGLPEIRDFLRTRPSVVYPAQWMGSLDAMARMQGWTDTSCIHYGTLAEFGEVILLTIRHIIWTNINDLDLVRTWLNVLQNEIRGYVHAYRVVTGVDLSVEPERNPSWATMPGLLLKKRRAV